MCDSGRSNDYVMSNDIRGVQWKPVRRVGVNGSNVRPTCMSQLNEQQTGRKLNVMSDCDSVVKDVILWFESGMNVSKEELIQAQVNDSSLRGLFVSAPKANNLQRANALVQEWTVGA